MNIYIYISAHDVNQAQAARDQLGTFGHTVVSTWHDDSQPVSDWKARARDNMQKIETADALVLIASKGMVSGGKFVEAGFALGIEIPVYVIGHLENNMLNHPNVTRFDNLDDFA